MSNKTFWAMKKREDARRKEVAATPRTVRGSTVRKAVEADVPYRELQAQAKELDIPAKQTAEELKAAIEKASE